MWTWMLTAAVAAWVMVAVILFLMGAFGLLGTLFWGMLFLGVGALTIFLYVVGAPQPNIVLLLFGAVLTPFGLLARH